MTGSPDHTIACMDCGWHADAAALMDLYAFQLDGVDFLATTPRGAPGRRYGTGQNRPGDRCRGSHRRPHASLSYARPSRVNMWRREFLTWQEIDRSIQVIRSAADARDITGNVVITSYALAHTITGKFDLMILDEAQESEDARCGADEG